MVNVMKKNNTKRNTYLVTDKRINFLIILMFILFLILLIRLIQVMVFKRSYYQKELELATRKVVYGDSTPRGRIYDRNYNLLVDNESVPILSYVKESNITVSEEIEMAYDLANNIKVSITNISINDLKDFYMLLYEEKSNSLITDEEWKKFDDRVLTSDDILNLKRSRISDSDLKVFKDLDKEACVIYFLMNDGYSYDEKVIKKSNLTMEEISYVSENLDKLKGFYIKYDWKRVYLYGDTLRSILGNISLITKEEKDYYLAKGYSLSDKVGSSFIEKQYEEYLKGTKSSYYVIDNKKILKEEGKRGNDIVLTIDIKLQQEIEKIIEEEIKRAKNEANTEYFRHAYVVIQDPNNGEILAMSGRELIEKDNGYIANDVTSGIVINAMTVGSVVKGASLYVGLNEGAVKIGESMKDECIKLLNKPKKCSWKTLGTVNDLMAIANSSNVYQFKIAMKVAGQPYKYNLDFNPDASVFDLYRLTFNNFGLGVKTGIDLPIESVGNIGDNTSGDLLLNFAIGQYDTYTTMQLSQYITTIASGGKRYKPHLLKEVRAPSSSLLELGEVIYEEKSVVLNTISNTTYLKRVQEAFHKVMTDGLGKNFMGYGRSNVAGKTGTSESFMDTDGDGKIDTPTLSNAFVGYAPYKNPKMTIAITFPNIVLVKDNNDLRTYANIRITRKISEKYFELYS